MKIEIGKRYVVKDNSCLYVEVLLIDHSLVSPVVCKCIPVVGEIFVTTYELSGDFLKSKIPCSMDLVAEYEGEKLEVKLHTYLIRDNYSGEIYTETSSFLAKVIENRDEVEIIRTVKTETFNV